MNQQDSYKSSHSENFDLDDYINEKANSGNNTNQFKPEHKPGKSSWFRNTMLILGFGILTLLYFNNWNPLQVYGNIFGVDKYQAGYIPPSNEIPTPLVIEIQPGNEPQVVDVSGLEQLAELEALEALEGLESLESLENLEALEASMTDLESLGEMNELREFALKTAMEALEGIGNSPEFEQVIGEASQLGIQEALKELQKLNELETLGAEQVAQNARDVNSSFIEYSGELAKLGLDEKFNNSSLQKFYEANVDIQFLQRLDELELLEKMTTDGIIKSYQDEGQ